MNAVGQTKAGPDRIGATPTAGRAAGREEPGTASALMLAGLAHLPIWVGWCEEARNGEPTKDPLRSQDSPNKGRRGRRPSGTGVISAC
jgi:hypothetical protein